MCDCNAYIRNLTNLKSAEGYTTFTDDGYFAAT